MIATLSAKETAEALGISYSTINRWIAEGRLSPVKVGRNNRFREDQIAEILGIELPAAAKEEKPVPVRAYPAEDKQQICNGLLAALRATRHYYDLERLEYSKDGRKETVTAFFAEDERVINVTADSGVSMIRDVIRGLAS